MKGEGFETTDKGLEFRLRDSGFMIQHVKVLRHVGYNNLGFTPV